MAFFLGQKLQLQSLDDGVRYFILNHENVGQIPIISFGPEMAARIARDELR